MQYIYLICNIRENTLDSKSSCGIFSSAEEAIASIKRNDGNMFEYWYSYAVVERYEVDKGISSKEIAWFKLIKYEDGVAQVEPCEKPEQYRSIRNFALG